jgi:hypothetical protein
MYFFINLTTELSRPENRAAVFGSAGVICYVY